HRFAGGIDVARLPLDSLADLDGVVVRIDAARRAIDLDVLATYDVAGRAVLVHTGWDRYWAATVTAPRTPSPPLPPPPAWASGRPHWLASTRSTSTTPATHRARCTPRCWRLVSRSWSTCAGLTSSRQPLFASTPPRPRSSASARSRSAPTP